MGEEGRSWGGISVPLSVLVTWLTPVANRFHRLFQRRFVDSGFLARCLEDSEEAQQECFS